MRCRPVKSCALCFQSLTVLLVTGCATGPVLPNKTYVRVGPDYNMTMPTVGRLGLLVDAAITYDEVGSEFFDIEDSRSAIANLAQETRTDLTSKGYELAFDETPFVGAFFNSESPAPVASGRNAEPHPMTPPFRTADYLDTEPDYRKALQTVDQRVLAALSNGGRFPTDSLQSNAATEAAMRVIADKMHVRYLLVVQGRGSIVSVGKQVGQVIGTAVVTAVLTLGMVSGSSHNISFLDSYVGLVDLQTAEVLWSNSLRLGNLNPAESGDYKRSGWAYNVLYWLPPRGTLAPLMASAQ
jgi:hypothetical protein